MKCDVSAMVAHIQQCEQLIREIQKQIVKTNQDCYQEQMNQLCNAMLKKLETVRDCAREYNRAYKKSESICGQLKI